MKRHQKLYLPLKRLIGIFGSLIGIVFCFSLLWWWVFIVNTIVTRGHPTFVHKRLGKNKKIFGLLKFRTMKLNANPNVAPHDMSKDEQKALMTKFGIFLRKTSIDETLQLFNILLGQMAFIGPRPGSAVNEEYLVKARDQFDPSAYAVKPGLGGYSQIKIHREHNPMLKAKYDHEYVLKMSLLFDIKLFVITILNVFGLCKGR